MTSVQGGNAESMHDAAFWGESPGLVPCVRKEGNSNLAVSLHIHCNLGA